MSTVGLRAEPRLRRPLNVEGDAPVQIAPTQAGSLGPAGRAELAQGCAGLLGARLGSLGSAWLFGAPLGSCGPGSAQLGRMEPVSLLL